MEASSASLSLVGSVVAERYRLTKFLGEGGMGAVFLAEHMLMRKRVALKLLHQDLSEDEEILGRFRREAQAAARVDHPNVAAATDFGQASDGSFFLVLEYVEGKSLRHVIEEGPLAPERALHVTRQVALALERAHEAGIVHRDLKPDNIMLVAKDGDPDFVKVLDFGIAKLESSSKDGKQIVTRYGTILGTPEYMSPEQAAGDPAGPPADLYSVGVMLYEMLTGKIPFDAAERTAILSMHIVAPPPRMRERAPTVFVPDPIDALVMRLLAKVPAERPADAVALRGEIEAAAAASNLTLPHVASSRFVDRASSPNVAPRPSDPTPAPTPWQNNDALAKTEYGIASDPNAAAPEATTVRGRKSLIPGLKLGPLDELPRPLAIAILGAPISILGFVLVVVVVSLASHGSKTANDANDASVDVPSTRTPTATAVQITEAKAAGVRALEALAKQYPEDAAVQAELARAFAAAGRHADLLAVVGKLDAAAVDDAIEAGVVAAAQNQETLDEAYALLEGPLEARGVDGLITLATMKPPRARAVKALQRPDVRKKASPAATVYLDLKDAKSCAQKRDVIARAHASGDARSLALLRPLREKRGCGFLGRGDCWACMHKDDELEDAIRAVEARAGAK